MSLGFSAEEQREWAERNRGLVEEKTGAPVLAYSIFYRTGSWGAMGAQQVSPLVASAMKFIGKRKAGGLPQQFILAVTDERLVAFSYKQRRNDVDVRDQVASWDRSGLRLNVEETKLTVRLTIECPADGTKLVCDTGKAAITNQFLARLGTFPAMAAAA